MDNKLIETATKIATPLSLASFIILIIYLIVKIILGLDIFVSLNENNTFSLILSIIDKIFYLAATGLILGIASYVYIKRFDYTSNQKLDIEALLKTGVFSGKTWSTREFFIVTNLATRLSMMQLGGADLVKSVREAEKLAGFVRARDPEKASDLMRRVQLLPSLENIGEKFALLSNWSESFAESFPEYRERCLFAVGLVLSRADGLFQIACQNLPMANQLFNEALGGLMEPTAFMHSLSRLGVPEKAARKIAQPFFEFQKERDFNHFRSAYSVGVETMLSVMG